MRHFVENKLKLIEVDNLNDYLNLFKSNVYITNNALYMLVGSKMRVCKLEANSWCKSVMKERDLLKMVYQGLAQRINLSNKVF